MLGLFNDFLPRHAKRYAELRDMVRDAAKQYIADVRSGAFPTDAQSFTMNESILDELRADEQIRAPA